MISSRPARSLRVRAVVSFLVAVSGLAFLPQALGASLTEDKMFVNVAEGRTATNSGTFSGSAGAAVTLTPSLGTITQTGTGQWAFQQMQSQGGNPIDLALDAQENLYVANENGTVYKYDAAGALVKAWTVTGTPKGLAVDYPRNRVYVTSNAEGKIYTFDLGGNALGSFGSPGTGDGQFSSIHAVAVDGSGNVYATDSGNSRVQVFDTGGNFVRKWGSAGSGDGQFDFPQGIRVAGNGYVYVADRRNHRIQIFHPTGAFVAKWGSFGSGNGQFNQPASVGSDPSGNIYVGDISNNRVQKFSAFGTYLDQVGPGSGDGTLSAPHGTVFPPAGRSVYIASWGNGRVVKYLTPGTWSWSYLAPFGALGTTPVTITANDGTGTATQTFNLVIGDGTGPRVQSIARLWPTTSPTRVSDVQFQISFNEPVSNVGPADFTVTGPTNPTITIWPKPGTGGAGYDVYLSGGNLATFDGVVTLALAANATINDAAGNPLTNSAPLGTNENWIEIIHNRAPTDLALSGSTISQSESVTPWLYPIGTFSATDPDAGETFTYSLVAGPGGTDNERFNIGLDTLTAIGLLPAGTLQIRVRVTDSGGLWFEKAFTITVSDDLAPDTGIASGPAAISDSASATFTFTSTEPGSTFEVSLDGASFVAASNPYTVTNGAEFSHTLAVRAVDAAGHVDASPASYYWYVDTSGPRLQVVQRASPSAASTRLTQVTFRAIFDEQAMGVDAADFVVVPGPGVTASLASVTNPDEDNQRFLIVVDQIAGNGTLGLALAPSATIVDELGHPLTNTATVSNAIYTIDQIRPTATLASTAPNPTKAAIPITIAFSETVTGFVASDITVTNGTVSGFTFSAGVYSATVTPTTAGAVTVAVNASVANDAATNGNLAAAPLTRTFDNVAPRLESIARLSPAASPTHADTLTFRVTFTEAVTGVDAADFTVAGTTATASVAAVSASVYDVTLAGGDLASLNGPVTLGFVAAPTIADAAGNTLTNTAPTGSSVNTFDVLNNQAPTNLVLAPATIAQSATFTSGATVGTLSTIDPDAGDTHTYALVSGVDSADNTNFTITGATLKSILGMQPDTFRIRVRTTDAGGLSFEKALTVTVLDDLAPNTSIANKPAALSNSASATFAFTATEAGATFEASLDNGAFVTVTSPKTYTGLADGAHTFSVRAKDAAGNADATPATYSWAVDATGPVITVPGSPIVAEATGPDGAPVSFAVSAVDANDGNVLATLSAASGSTFRLGDTEITVTARDSAGNVSTKAFTVSVRDTTAPVLSAGLSTSPPLNESFNGYHGGIATGGQYLSGLHLQYGGNVPGWTKSGFANAVHAVNLSGTGNWAIMFYAPDVLTLTDGIAANASGKVYAVSFLAGPAVYQDPSQATGADDGLRIEILRADGSVLKGFDHKPGAYAGASALTPASFAYTGDGSGNVRVRLGTIDPAAGRFGGVIENLKIAVSQADTGVPAQLEFEATSPAGAIATFDAVAFDLVSLEVPVTAAPASGTTFAIGVTPVTLTAIDAANNRATKTFNIIVRDTVRPVLSLPAAITAEATSPAGATVIFAATATDTASTPTITYSRDPGTTFPLGLTTVTVTATDGAGLQASGAFNVTVVDTIAPETTITAQPVAPGNSATATFAFSGADSGSGVVRFEASLDGGAFTTVTSPHIFSGLADGAHTVALRAVDAVGNLDATPASYAWSIDTRPPVIAAASVSGTYRAAFTHTVAADEPSVTFAATGLPAGLSLNATTGEISGAPIASGTFTIALTATDAAGNTGPGSLTISLAKVNLTIAGLTAADRVFDATINAQLNVSGATLVGVLSGDNVALNSSAAAGTFADKRVGTAKTVTITGLSLTGTHATHYTFTAPTATATITPRTLTVAGATAASKVYDGNTVAALGFASATLGNVAGPDAVTLISSSATGAFANGNVGVAKTVTVSGLALTGGDASNYTLTPPALSADITARPITVAAAAKTKVYNASDPALTYTIANGTLVAGESFTGALTRTVGENVGTYAINRGTLALSANYALTFQPALLTITAAPATIAFGDLTQPYDGQPKPVTVTTAPVENLATSLTYNGSTTAPTLPGAYTVVATITNSNYSGSATDTLLITITSLVRHAPSLNGDIEGSLQVLLPESVTLNGGAMISGDLLVPGTPTVRLNGHPTFAGTVDSTGAANPSSHQITLNGSAVLRKLVRRVDALTLPTVAAPPAPTGTRSVTLNKSTDAIGDWATLRHLTLNGNTGVVPVPPGTYGTLIANGSNNGFALGVAGSTTRAVYNLQNLTLNGNTTLRIVGPVTLTLANGVQLNGNVGDLAHPEWLTLRVASGDVTLNGNIAFAGDVIAPGGQITINGNSTLKGHVSADRLTVNGNSLLVDPETRP